MPVPTPSGWPKSINLEYAKFETKLEPKNKADSGIQLQSCVVRKLLNAYKLLGMIEYFAVDDVELLKIIEMKLATIMFVSDSSYTRAVLKW